MTVYVENRKDSTFKKLLELINAFTKVTVLQGQFSQFSFYTLAKNNYKMEIFKVPFTRAQKILKCIG